MNMTDLMSLSALIISIISLTITWLKYINEKAEIKLSLSHIEGRTSAYFFPLKDIRDNFSQKPYRIFIQVDIFNNSCLPTTIYEIQSDIKNIGKLYFTEYIRAADQYDFKISSLDTFTVPIGKNQINLPLEMTPYKMKRGYIFFPVKQELENDTYHLTLTILSSRGKFTYPPIVISRLNPTLRFKEWGK